MNLPYFDGIINTYLYWGDYALEYQKLLLGENPYLIAHIQASYPMHCHNEIEVFYCTKGEARVIVEEKEYTLCEGSIFFVSSLAMHQITIENNASVFVIEFGSQFLGASYKEIADKSFTKCLINPDEDCTYRNRITKPLKKLCQEYNKRETGSYWAIKGYLYELFAMIVRYIPMKSQSTQKQKMIDRYLKIQKVIDLVHQEYNTEISLERAATAVGYDPRAFCRLFKSITNMTFHDYLNFHRINVATRLLEYKSYSIGEVGQMTGIPVAKTFARLFRKYTGMSPSEYRKKFFETDIEEEQ